MTSRGRAAWALASALVLALGACDNTLQRRDGSIIGEDDAGTRPPVPELDPPPTVVAWPLVTLRGTAPEGRRVLVRGAENPIAVPVLPDDRFCIDVPLPVVQPYTLEVLAHGQSGLFSDPASAMVEFDPSAPIGAVPPTCSGADPRGCMGETEICDNRVDDDCDGRADDDDPDCASCANDLLEDNDTLEEAPRLPPGEYPDLVVCPGDEDHYALFLRPGETVTATIQFTHAEGDLELALYDPSGAEVDSSLSVDDEETVSFTAAEEGEHVLRVFGAGASTTAPYRLILSAS